MQFFSWSFLFSFFMIIRIRIQMIYYRQLKAIHWQNKGLVWYEVHTISFQTFFVWPLLLIVHTWNSSPLRSNLLRLQCTCCIVPTTSEQPHGRLPAFFESLMPLKNWCSIHARCSKSSLKHSIRFCGIFFQF